MRWYSIAMMVHMLGLIAVFAGFAMQHRAGARLRNSRTYADARPWSDLLFVSRPMVPSGAIMLLLSGGYLATPLWQDPPAWLIVSAIAVCVIAATALVVNPRITRIHANVMSHDGRLNASVENEIHNPRLWSPHAAGNGIALSILWLMIAKPQPLEAVIIPIVAALAGAIAGAIAGARIASGTLPRRNEIDRDWINDDVPEHENESVHSS
jgi:hypothetical protein